MEHNFRSIILWKEPRLTGAIFACGLFLYIAISLYSVILVFTCIAIPTLAVTLLVRAVLATKALVFKQPNDNPFRCWLDEKWELRGERLYFGSANQTILYNFYSGFSIYGEHISNQVKSINRRAADYANAIVLLLKKIILVEDFIESLKGLVFLFVWYYIGKNISTLTLLFIGYIGLFSIPLLYEMKRKEIDNFMRQVCRKYEEFYQCIIDIIPGSIAYPKSAKKSKEKKEVEKED